LQYRKFADTDIMLSTLGFGAMRLSQNEDEAIPVIQRAIDLGVNYIDTAQFYVEGKSEVMVGKAIKKYPREKIILSTKIPMWDGDYTASGWRKKLEAALGKMQVDHIDLLALCHDLRLDTYDKTLKISDNWIKEAEKAKKEGLYRHAIISSHDTPDNIISLFQKLSIKAVILQYNLLDRTNEKVIEYAHKNNKSIITMGTVAGGRLGPPSPEMQALIPGGAKSSVEAALRFVLSNTGVTSALSGMSTIQMVEENCEIASRSDILSGDELKKILFALEEKRKLAELYCTGCNYCMPCPNGVNIPENFSLMNNYRIYGIKDPAVRSYRELESKKASAGFCNGCRQCEEKCPQKIKIEEQLKEVKNIFGKIQS